MIDTNTILKLISDSFGPKAESIDVEFFNLYFEHRHAILNEMKMPLHQFILGRRGTGKTTFLKYHDLGTVSISQTTIKSLPCIGFYVNLGRFAIPNFQLLSPELASEVFIKWLPLRIIYTIVDGFIKCKKRGLMNVDDQSISDIFNPFFLEAKISSLPSFFESVGEEVNRLEVLCCKQDFNTRDISAENTYALKNIPLDIFINGVSRNIKNVFAKFDVFLMGVFFLFDRFDEMPPILQSIAIKLINWSSPQEYYVKVGITKLEKIDLKDIPVRDYKILDIEFPFSLSSYNDFRTFALSVLRKRLKVVCDSLRKIDATDRIIDVLSDLNKMFGDGLNTKDASFYHGIDSIIRLSSRNISIFLSLIYSIIRNTISNQQDLDVLRAVGTVPVDVQNKSIKSESSSRYYQEFKSQASPQTIKLLKFLMSQLYPKTKSERYLRFAFTGSIEAPQNRPVLNSLGELINLTILNQILDPELEGECELSQFFLPHWDKPLASGGSIDIPISRAKDYITGEAIIEKDKSGQKELFETKPVCFYPTGFRNAWENKVRELLRKSIFPENGLEYKDGSDYHPDTNEIGETVKRLIQDVDFFIVEKSTYNENVAFEMGLGIACKKPMYAIQNNLVTQSDISHTPSQDFRDLVESYKHETYKFKYEKDVTDSNINPDYIESLKAAIAHLSEIYKNLPAAKRTNVNPFDSSILLIPSPLTDKTVNIYCPTNSRLSSWRTDIENKLREEKISNPYPLRAETIKVKNQIIISNLQAICRSKHCIIDTSGKDQYSCLLLGFAMGIGAGEVLHVFDASSRGLFTNWKGWPYRPYNTKEELWAIIKEFIQSS